MSSATLRRWNRHMSLQMRMVLVTAAAVTTMVAVGGFLILLVVRAELIEGGDAVAAERADMVADMAARGSLPAELALQDDVDTAVQVVADGRVIRRTPNAGGAPIVTLTQPPGTRQIVAVDRRTSEDTEPFRVTAVGTSTPVGSATVLVAVSTEDIEDIVAASTRWGVLGLVLLLLPLCGILWVAIGRTLAPVMAIRQRAEAIGGRFLDQRVPEPARLDEIGRLARTINAMLARLEASADQQRRFLADAAHELRSPITSLRAQLESTPPAGREAASVGLIPDLLADTLRMQTLVDQLLLLARSDAGMIGHGRVSVDLDDTIDYVVALRRFEHERVDVEVDQSDVRPVQVLGEPTLLEQVVRNLLDNAVRHANRQVRVTLVEEAGEAVLTVDDDGPGIPAEHRDEVFLRFARLDASRDREDGGVGLGLAIVADIVHAHAGSVQVGDSPTGGARIRVRLPASGTAASQEDRPVAAV